MSSSNREILCGKNVVLEILRANKRKVFRVFWSRASRDEKSEELKRLIAERKIHFLEVYPDKIEEISGNPDHQGVACEVSPFEFTSVEEVVAKTKSDPKGGFLLLLDELQDPHNVGALIRTAHLCGAKGIVLLKHRQALLTSSVCKAASGAQEYLPIVKETNLVNVINYLKDNDFSIYGAAGGSGKTIYDEPLRFPLGLVLGGEGKGIRRLVKENCDFLVSIPMEGEVGSFNVSVAGGILMGEILRQRTLSAVYHG